MHFSRKNQPELLEEAKQATRSTGFKSDAIALGAYDGPEGELKAVGVFQNFTGTQAEFHFGLVDGDQITRQTIGAFVAVAFHKRMFGLTRMLTTIEAANRRALVAAIKMGFQIEARVRSGMPDGSDAILLSIVPQDVTMPLPG